MVMPWEEHHIHHSCNLHKIASEMLVRPLSGVRLWDLAVALVPHGWRLAHAWRPHLSGTEAAVCLNSPDGLTK